MKNASFSFELFPPRKDDSIEGIYKTLNELQDLKPDFISVTFGAGGSANSKNTLDIASAIQDIYHTKSIVHLPCIHLNKGDIEGILKECKARGLKNILALRGDLIEGKSKSKDFSYASDLVEFIKQKGDFNIYAAAYPEKHNEAKSFLEDIHNLKIKVESGADTLLTQLFFDNEDFYKFKEKCALAGIKVPIFAGIMPITNKRQVLKITSLCGAKIPAKFQTILDKWGDSEALEDAGIAYAIDQIVDLLTNDTDGVHLFIMNKSKVAQRIYKAVKNLF